MKKYLFLAAMAALLMGFNGCKDEGPSGNGGGGSDSPSGKVMEPEEAKEELKNIADEVLAKFKNVENQRATMELMDNMIYKYENYDFSPIGDYFENRYEDMFRVPRYMSATLKGESPVPALENRQYTFSMATESIVWEANDETLTWEDKGPASDNSIIFRAKDANGVWCEAKFWGEGATKEYSYALQNEYEDEIIKAIVPEKLCFSFKYASNQLAGATVRQDLAKNDHATVNLDVQVVGLRWTTDLDIHSTNGTVGYALYYGNDKLYSFLVNLPDYKLIPKGDKQPYDEWAYQYAERYPELIQSIGSADAVLDLIGRLQIKISINNGGQTYSDVMNMMNRINPSTSDGAQQYCDVINNAQSNGLYIDNAKQAEVRLIVSGDGEHYAPDPVLYFVSDGTTYAFNQYFDQNLYMNLQQSVETLANNYIHLSSWLSSHVGEVHF